MSAVAVLRHILAADATLIAQVPAARIMAGVIPINTTLPAISVTEISAVDRKTVAMNDGETLVTSRVQVTIMAKTYPLVKSILELARKACAHQTGTINSVAVKSILPESAGPDLQDVDAGIFMQSRDWLVQWAATN